MNRYKADELEDVVPFDFISKSIYSISHSNPKRRVESPLKEALDDVIREVKGTSVISFRASTIIISNSRVWFTMCDDDIL